MDFQFGKSKNYPTGILEIPEVALQEVVVNALIHRDYFISSSIKIFIFDNRVEIRSPGKLPNTATMDKIKGGVQISRNPVLLSFVSKFATLGKMVYRGIGSGIPRIIQECKEANIPEPDFIEDKTAEQFKVIFRRIEGDGHSI